MRTMDHVLRRLRGKGKGKASEPVAVRRKDPDLLSRIHLVIDGSGYAYHLHPMMPALYRIAIDRERAVDSDAAMALVHAPDDTQIAKLDFQQGPRVGTEPQTTWFGFDDSEVLLYCFSLPRLISAKWSMTVSGSPLDLSIQPENGSFSQPNGKAAEAASEPSQTNDSIDDDPPPPYSEKDGEQLSTQALPPAVDLDRWNGSPASTSERRPNNASETILDDKAHDQKLAFDAPPSGGFNLPRFESKSDHTLDEYPNRHLYDQNVPFTWTQVSSRARLKLTHPVTDKILAEYIQETDAINTANGVKGQLLFRRSFGREWQLAVLLTLGLLVEVGKGKVWDE